MASGDKKSCSGTARKGLSP